MSKKHNAHEDAVWYVESDGYGPYIVANGGGGRVATIECQAFSRNGGPDDWRIAHLLSSAPDMRKSVEKLLELLSEVRRLNDPSLIDDNMLILQDAARAVRKADHSKE